MLAKRLGVLDGQRVERGLGRHVGQRGWPPGEVAVRVGHQRERAEAAGDVDDASRRRAQQQRDHRGRHADDTEDVGLEHLPDDVHLGAAGILPGQVAEDPRVVDQDVEHAEVIADVPRGRHDGRAVGDVELDRPHVGLVRSQLRGRLLTAARVPGGQQHGHAQLRELRDDLASDALVRTGDQRRRRPGGGVPGHDRVPPPVHARPGAAVGTPGSWRRSARTTSTTAAMSASVQPRSPACS